MVFPSRSTSSKQICLVDVPPHCPFNCVCSYDGSHKMYGNFIKWDFDIVDFLTGEIFEISHHDYFTPAFSSTNKIY